jgi:DNA-binding transcriptional MocR family regulator
MDQAPLYRRLAAHYRDAIEAGTLVPGDRFPSVRSLMGRHEVSLSTALQVCRQLESDGWLEARPRSGNFVRQPRRQVVCPLAEPVAGQALDPASYVGMHARVSEFIARGRQSPVKVNFSSARSAPSLYPGEALKNAATRALRRDPELLVRPAPNNGNAGFRSVLARRAMANGMLLAPEDILITQGCIEALNLALRAVTQPGDIVAVESPTFYGLLQVLETLGLRALEIPTSPFTGISIEALELAVRGVEPIKALVVVPHLQNPLGCIMPDSHKARLVAFCSTHAIPLIEDDTYSALTNDDAPLKALKAWDGDGNVIHCASLHKILAPGLRLGWMNAGRWQSRVEMLKYVQSRYNEELSQLAAADFMGSSAYDRHLRRLRSSLKSQRARSAEAIAAYFPEGTRLTDPDGGLALWVELPNGLSSRALFDAALAEGIFIAPGLMFSNSNRFDGYIRLNCGAPYTPEIEAALKRLGELCGQPPRNRD